MRFWGSTLRLLLLLRLLERRFLAACMIVMSVAYFVNVLVRELYPAAAASFAWIEEATLFLFAWLVFAGLGLTLERGRHITMTAGVERMSARQLFFVRKLVNLVGFGFSVYIGILGLQLTHFIFMSGQISPTLNVSMAFLYASVPVGFALLAVRYLLELLGRTDRFAAGRETAATH
jgi:C4-dicarboxylate transporter DctQ subunit